MRRVGLLYSPLDAGGESDEEPLKSEKPPKQHRPFAAEAGLFEAQFR